jgi:hypothetical protein
LHCCAVALLLCRTVALLHIFSFKDSTQSLKFSILCYQFQLFHFVKFVKYFMKDFSAEYAK